MEIEKLIKHMREEAQDYRSGRTLGRAFVDAEDVLDEAATAHTAGFIKSKSGLNVKHNLTSDGVIDVGYTGSICVKLYNHGDKPYQVERGDKISQLVVVKIETPELELVDELEETDRGNNGFGSTGR